MSLVAFIFPLFDFFRPLTSFTAFHANADFVLLSALLISFILF